MKIGDRFASFNDMQSRMRKVLGKAFPLMGAFIPELPGHPGVCCAKHVFYNDEFPLRKKWWNELNASKNANGYGVDATSFPLRACNMSSNIITYPHKVLKRVSDVWGE